jgi:hypothetical protein
MPREKFGFRADCVRFALGIGKREKQDRRTVTLKQTENRTGGTPVGERDLLLPRQQGRTTDTIGRKDSLLIRESY